MGLVLLRVELSELYALASPTAILVFVHWQRSGGARPSRDVSYYVLTRRLEWILDIAPIGSGEHKKYSIERIVRVTRLLQ